MGLRAHEGGLALKKRVAAFLLLTALHTAASAQSAGVAPYRPRLKQPLSAAAALKSYEKMLGKVKALGAAAVAESTGDGSGSEPFDCPGLDGSARRCVSGDGSYYYVGEFLPHATNTPAAVPGPPPPSSLEGGAAELGWVPAEMVVGGRTLLTALEGSLAKRELEGCDGDPGECRTVVEAAPAVKGERVLAVCDLIRVGEERGPVRNCEAVAVVAPGAQYLRAVVGYKPGAEAAGKPDVWDSVVMYRLGRDSEEVELPDGKKVLEAMRGGLETGMVKLKSELAPRDDPRRVVGVAAPRVSPLGSRNGWLNIWENASVLVEVSPESGGFTLKVSFVLLLRRGGSLTSPSEEFREPTPSEVGVYENALHASLRRPLESLCGRGGRWQDLKTLVCDGPRPAGVSGTFGGGGAR